MKWNVRVLVGGLLVMLCLGGSASLVLAQTATPGQSLAWSHPTAAAELVTRFETNYDGAGYVRYEEYPAGGGALGRFWTQARRS